MSDYLGNLITRTSSEAAAVRPHLPSLFEPSVASGQVKSDLEFEQKTFSESSPFTHRSETTPSILTSKHEVSNKREATPIAHPGKSHAPVLNKPQSVLGEPEPTPIVHEPKTSAPSSPSVLPSRSANKKRESESVPVRAKSNVELVASDFSKNDSRTDQRESRSPRTRASKAPRLVSQLSTPDPQPKSPSLVKPLSPVRKIRSVEAVVPTIHTSRHFLRIPARAAPPSINVTIGRIEIRATSLTPTAQHAQLKSSKVLSLEEYLRRRASGGSR